MPHDHRTAIAAALLLGLACATAHAQTRPNMIIFLSDDHATNAVGCYGSVINATPNIDRLAAEGVRFDRLFCTNGICAPARATILTGQLSHVHGVVDNRAVFDVTSGALPHLLQDAGYQTAMVGKWHLKSDPTGFDYWNVLPGQGDYYNPVFIENGTRTKYEGYVSELITEFALAWLERRDPDKPFCLFVQHKAPHRAWLPGPNELDHYESAIPEPPTLFDDYATRSDAARLQEMTIARHMRPLLDLKIAGVGDDSDAQLLRRFTPAQRDRWRAAYDPRNAALAAADPEGDERTRWYYQRYIADYLRCIDAIDTSVGRVVAELDRAGLADDTLVAYTSDQGFFLGEHGWYDKRFMYEESLRVPFVVRWPGVVTPGTTNDAMLMNVDVAPTLLDIAGADMPQPCHGASFRTMLTDGTTPADWRDAVYYHYFEYPGAHSVRRHYGIRTERYKLMRFYYDVDAWELYDLDADPLEVRNVADDPAYADVRADLAVRLDAMQIAYGDRPSDFEDPMRPHGIVHAGVGATVTFAPPPARPYARNADTLLTDGRWYDVSSHAAGLYEGWLGFNGDCTATIDLGTPMVLARVGVHLRHDPGAWIHLPQRVQFETSLDGTTWRFPAAEVVAPGGHGAGTELIMADLSRLPVRYVRVTAERLTHIPDGFPGAGQPAWVFVDEIIAEPAVRFARGVEQ